MNILTSTEALRLINERLQKPITPQLFNRTILPEMERSGDAQRVGRRQSSVVDKTSLDRWIAYLAERERRILAGEWNSKRPYSIADLEATTWKDEG